MTAFEILTKCASIGVALMTGYFWLVAAREQRARLDVRWLGVKDTSQHTVEPAEGGDANRDEPARYLVTLVQFWVSNMSLLPNAILGVRVQVRDREGNWIGTSATPLKNTNAYKEPNELPLTLPPRDMAIVSARVWIPVAGATLERYRDSRDYWAAFASTLSAPVEFRVEVRGLDGRTFTTIVRVPDPAN